MCVKVFSTPSVHLRSQMAHPGCNANGKGCEVTQVTEGSATTPLSTLPGHRLDLSVPQFQLYLKPKATFCSRRLRGGVRPLEQFPAHRRCPVNLSPPCFLLLHSIPPETPPGRARSSISRNLNSSDFGPTWPLPKSGT